MKEDVAMRAKRAAESVRMLSELSPRIGVILGSGLSGVVDAISGTEVSYSQIEGFPAPTVPGHRGMLKLNRTTAVMAGRFHYYEGHPIDLVVLPIFLLHAIGVRTLIVTNAAGAVNRQLNPGDLVLIRDHINLMGVNPLIGPNDGDLGPRFPDMSQCYAERLRDVVRGATRRRFPEGVYAALSGPSYETPAEIRMLAAVGADLVGMSTVPEVICARYLGMEVLGVSCVTNMAAGISKAPLDHREVVETGKRVAAEMSGVILKTLDALAADVS